MVILAPVDLGVAVDGMTDVDPDDEVIAVADLCVADAEVAEAIIAGGTFPDEFDEGVDELIFSSFLHNHILSESVQRKLEQNKESVLK